MTTTMLSTCELLASRRAEPESNRATGQPIATPVRRPGVRRFARAVRRPSGRDDRVRGPRLRPATGPSFPRAATAPGDSLPRRTALGSAAASGSWRLTERGIAVVLVTGLMIVLAAVTVVAATAIRVTSDHYQVTGQLQH